MNSFNLYPELVKTAKAFRPALISEERKNILKPLIDYLNNVEGVAKLNFICTHNSRRSQFAQIWAQVAASFYEVDVQCYSGGIEVTEFNENAINAVRRAGFKVMPLKGENPQFHVTFSKELRPIVCYSKLYNDPANPVNGFAAIMTCSDADEKCPLIPGAETRIALNYSDPKEFDGTAKQNNKYDERCIQIANEMFYVFSQLTNER